MSVLTHLLLSTLIASSLNARLSSPLSLIIIIIATGARAALELNAAALSLVAATSPWAGACRRTRSPTTHGALTSVHAGCRKGSKLPRSLLLMAKPEEGAQVRCFALRVSGVAQVHVGGEGPMSRRRGLSFEEWRAFLALATRTLRHYSSGEHRQLQRESINDTQTLIRQRSLDTALCIHPVCEGAN